MTAILTVSEVQPQLSDEHFSVDDTLAKAGASMKIYQPTESSVTPDEDAPGGPPPSTGETLELADQPQQTETQAKLDAPKPDPQRKREVPGKSQIF